jgi:poly(3-hydroxybutyrate) depolymerase
MGFRGAILHGFAGMARAWAGLERAFSPHRLKVLDVRFVRPILLPADVALCVDGDRVFVASLAGEPFMTGTFALSSTCQEQA